MIVVNIVQTAQTGTPPSDNVVNNACPKHTDTVAPSNDLRVNETNLDNTTIRSQDVRLCDNTANLQQDCNTPTISKRTSNDQRDQWFEVSKMLAVKCQKGKYIFRLLFVDGYKSFIAEQDISPALIKEYFCTHTQKGRRRKRKQ